MTNTLYCSRTLAESSPYYESLKNKEQEVLFCYEPYDELVLMQLQQFRGYRLMSVEKDLRDDKAANDLSNLGKFIFKKCFIVNGCVCVVFSRRGQFKT